MLTDLLDEIEERLRMIVREEVRRALLEIKNPNTTTDFSEKTKSSKSIEKQDFPTILTAPEIAELLGISVQRVYELVRTRKSNNFPVITLGERQYRFNKNAILEWINQGVRVKSCGNEFRRILASDFLSWEFDLL